MAVQALLVEDDAALAALLVDYLAGYGVATTVAGSLAAARLRLADDRAPRPDILLLDLGLPDGDGLGLCRWVRGRGDLPILMLTAQGDPASRIVGLELGADDYLPKPFEPRELVARIQAVLRRGRAAALAGPCRFAGWTLDREQRRLLSPQQVVVPLSSNEYRLLSTLLAHAGRPLGRAELVALLDPDARHAQEDEPAAMRRVDLAVSRLRQKLGDPAREPRLIRTVRGQGYQLDREA